MKLSHFAVLAPAFYISRIMGVAPIVVKKNQDGILHFEKHRALLAIPLLHIIGAVCISGCMTIVFTRNIVKNNLSYAPYILCMNLSCYCVIVVLGSSIFNDRHTARAFNEIRELSHHLLKKFDYSRLPLEASFAPIVVVIMTLRYILHVLTFSTSGAVLLAGYHHSHLVYLSSESLATSFLFYVETFFKCLDTELSHIRLNLDSTQNEIQTSLILCRIKRLRKLHSRICDLYDLVCERFSLDIFIIFGVTFLTLLSTLYAGIWARNITSTWLLKTLNISHYGFTILRLAHICYRSDCTRKQSEVLNAKVRSLMTAYLPGEIKQEIYHFTLQTMLRKVEITACGFYYLRMETMATFAYLVTTYLVMVFNLVGII